MSFHTKVHPEPVMDGNDSPKPFLAGRAENSEESEADTFVLSPAERRVSSCLLSSFKQQTSKIPAVPEENLPWGKRLKLYRCLQLKVWWDYHDLRFASQLRRVLLDVSLRRACLCRGLACASI